MFGKVGKRVFSLISLTERLRLRPPWRKQHTAKKMQHSAVLCSTELLCSTEYSRPPPHTMCSTAFLAPTLTAKTCSATKCIFSDPACAARESSDGKKSLPSSRPKKGTKMVPNSGSFQEEFFLLSGQKKSQKLDRSSFEGTNPTPPSPIQRWRPPARMTIVSRTVGHHLTQCAPPPS